MNALPIYLVEIAKKYNIKLTRSEYCGYNEGASAGDEIMLGDFDDKDKEIVAFFHELAHCTFRKDIEKIHNIKAPKFLSFLSNEGLCWEYGLYLAKINGYEWELNSEIYKYAHEQYLTYICNEYDRSLYRNEYNKSAEEIIYKLKLSIDEK